MNWTCPYCQRDQVVTDGQRTSYTDRLSLGSTKFGECGIHVVAIACSNKDCGEVSLTVGFGPGAFVKGTGSFRLGNEKREWHHLRPDSLAKPQPACVPEALTKDYYEACAIRDLSPKASATLSRRVLQGMIRDFCGIKADTLYKEIEKLKQLSDDGQAPQGVAIETIDAMHHVRNVGNIGAHMESDIDVVVDVDPGEAQALIELVEMLFSDWYVERDLRKKKLAALKGIADAKAEAKKAKKKPEASPSE